MGRQQKGSNWETDLESICHTCDLAEDSVPGKAPVSAEARAHSEANQQQTGLTQVAQRVPLCSFSSSSGKLLELYRKETAGAFSQQSFSCLCKAQLHGQLLNITLSSMMVATSGRPWTTLARPGNKQIRPFSFTYQCTTWLCLAEGRKFIYLHFSATAASLKMKRER